MEPIVLDIYLWFKIYFLIDTNTKMWTEITDLVVFRKKLLKFLQGVLVKCRLCEVRLAAGEIYKSPKWFFTPWYFSIVVMENDVRFFYRVDDNLLVKISDFGLTKELRDSNCYHSRGETQVLPVRWMSTEALTDHVFTKQSDVVRKIFV